MSVDYSTTAINARLEGVITTIDSTGNGYLKLLTGTTVVSTIQLARPCGTVDSGVLTFTGTLSDPAATGSSIAVDGAKITTVGGTDVVTGLTVGIPSAVGYDITLSNGLNSTVIAAGQTVLLLSAQITGS